MCAAHARICSCANEMLSIHCQSGIRLRCHVYMHADRGLRHGFRQPDLEGDSPASNCHSPGCAGEAWCSYGGLLVMRPLHACTADW